MRPIIYPYNMGSGSARRLHEELRSVRAKRVRPDGNYSHDWDTHLIINWGNSNPPLWYRHSREHLWLNHPNAVKAASNKLIAFQKLREANVQIPEFTTDSEEASVWLETSSLMARTKLTGHSGEGCYFCSAGEEVAWGHDFSSPVKLWVKYIKKKHEYRVHVFKGEVIDLQQKRKRRDVEENQINHQIRNHSNGWVYCRDDIVTPDASVLSSAIAAVSALRLAFGAVDIIWNEHYKQAYVLEVNTAPGLFETTLHKYAEAIRGVL